MGEFILGTTPHRSVERDAVHVAFFCGVAGCRLDPGEHVGFVDGKISRDAEKCIGITDPFLKKITKKGDAVIVCLYPGTVHGMRHHWGHDVVDSLPPMAISDKEQSEQWLRAAAIQLGVNYDQIVAEWSPLENDDYINNGEDIRNIWCDIEDEFWKHHKIVTGRDIPKDRRGGFTCSC